MSSSSRSDSPPPHGSQQRRKMSQILARVFFPPANQPPSPENCPFGDAALEEAEEEAIYGPTIDPTKPREPFSVTRDTLTEIECRSLSRTYNAQPPRLTSARDTASVGSYSGGVSDTNSEPIAGLEDGDGDRTPPPPKPTPLRLPPDFKRPRSPPKTAFPLGLCGPGSPAVFSPMAQDGSPSASPRVSPQPPAARGHKAFFIPPTPKTQTKATAMAARSSPSSTVSSTPSSCAGSPRKGDKPPRIVVPAAAAVKSTLSRPAIVPGPRTDRAPPSPAARQKSPPPPPLSLAPSSESVAEDTSGEVQSQPMLDRYSQRLSVSAEGEHGVVEADEALVAPVLTDMPSPSNGTNSPRGPMVRGSTASRLAMTAGYGTSWSTEARSSEADQLHSHTTMATAAPAQLEPPADEAEAPTSNAVTGSKCPVPPQPVVDLSGLLATDLELVEEDEMTPSGMSASSEDAHSSSPTNSQEEATQQPVHTSTSGAFFSAAPRCNRFIDLIDYFLELGGNRTLFGFDTIQNDDEEDDKRLQKYFSLECIMELCTAAIEVLAAEPSLLRLNVADDDTLVVVGDIHGQFTDLYASILEQQYSPRSNPSRIDKRFLFLGDFVDRGPHSIEVIMLVLALKVEYPDLIFITRGNHEELKTSRVYGFLTEMETKFGGNGLAAWEAVNDVFCSIPLAAVVQTPHMRFFAAHGGLSPDLEDDFTVIEEITRTAQITSIQDPNSDIVNGLLWSDPTDDDSMYWPNPRGCGYLFGSAASTEFCSKNEVDFICRAHQVVMDGFFWKHDRRVLTVFSAPNYCGVNGNRGAIMLVDGQSKEPRFAQYDAYEDRADLIPSPRMNFAYAACFT